MESNYCPASIQKDFRFSMEALKVIFRNCAFGSRRALKSPNSSHGKWVDGFKLDLTVEKALSSLLLGPNLGVANGTSLISRYNNCQLQSRPGIKRSVRNQTPSRIHVYVLRNGLLFKSVLKSFELARGFMKKVESHNSLQLGRISPFCASYDGLESTLHWRLISGQLWTKEGK